MRVLIAGADRRLDRLFSGAARGRSEPSSSGRIALRASGKAGGFSGARLVRQQPRSRPSVRAQLYTAHEARLENRGDVRSALTTRRRRGTAVAATLLTIDWLSTVGDLTQHSGLAETQPRRFIRKFTGKGDDAGRERRSRVATRTVTGVLRRKGGPLSQGSMSMASCPRGWAMPS